MADDRDVAAFKAEMERRKRVAATKQGGTQLAPTRMAPKAPPPPDASPDADFSGVTNPKRVIEKRMRAAEQGMACGGKVKRMASGGAVRGGGCAIKGVGKGKMR